MTAIDLTKTFAKDTDTNTEYNFADMKKAIRVLIKKTGITQEELDNEK